MRIPKSFKLFGATINVEIVKDFKDEDPDGSKNILGCYSFNRQRIQLRKQSKILSKQTQEHTYLHELTHAILIYMQHPQAQDEAFVDVFAGLLHQSMTTSEYK